MKTNKTEEKKCEYLSCIHCNHEFTLNEVFVGFMDEEGIIVVSSCIDRGHPVNDKADRPGTGWAILKRLYNKYELINQSKI